jgi:hypothetical protein
VSFLAEGTSGKDYPAKEHGQANQYWGLADSNKK